MVICKNCKTTVKDDSLVCPNCGCILKKTHKGTERQRVIQQNNIEHPNKTVAKPKRKTWLWVLGWLFIFPVPLTILLLRNKNHRVFKIAGLAAAWLLYLGIFFSPTDEGNIDPSPTIESETETAIETEPEIIVSLDISEETAETESTNKSIIIAEEITEAENPEAENLITAIELTHSEKIELKVGDDALSGILTAVATNQATISQAEFILVSTKPEVGTISWKIPDGKDNLHYEISGITAGETVLYVTTLDGNTKSQEIHLVVADPIYVKSIEFKDYKNSLEAGQDMQIRAIANPDNAENKVLTWTSSNENVATVDGNGNVTAVAEGTVEIAASTDNGVSQKIQITVTEKKEEVKKEEPQEEMVWIPTNGGKKYHTHASCSNMIDPKQVTISEAKKKGFTACGRCH